MKLRINLVFSIFSFLVSVAINLWYPPFIIAELGAEVYGYIAVVVNLVNVANVLTVALTSMCSRFMTMELEKKNIDYANEIFNSVLFATSFLCILIFIGGIFATINLNSIMSIAKGHIFETQILFIEVLISFIIIVVSTAFQSGIYYQNKLYVYYIYQIIMHVLRAVFAIVFFKYWKAYVWVPYLGSLLADLGMLIFYVSNYSRYLTGIKIKKEKFSISTCLEMLKSGIWISVTRMGGILSNSLNTYFSNIWVGELQAGVYASLSQIYNLLVTVVGSVCPILLPNMFKLYASADKKKVVLYTKNSITLINVPLGIICGAILCLGDKFVYLWLGKEMVSNTYILYIIIIGLLFSLPTEILNQLNMTANKNKIPAYITLLSGILNIFILFILCRSLNFGNLGIAIGQSVVLIMRGFILTPIYSAHIFGIPKYTFYKPILSVVPITILTIIIGELVKKIHLLNGLTWIQFLTQAFITGVVSLVLAYCFLVNRDTKAMLFSNKG